MGIGMEVSYLGAFTDGSALACCTAHDGPFGELLPKMPGHLVASAEAWSLGINTVSGTAVDDEQAPMGGLHDGGVLLTNGTRYRWEVAFDGTSERAYVFDQKGNVFTEQNPAFFIKGRRCYFQVHRPNAAANTRPRIHKVWVTTKRLDWIVSARAIARTAPAQLPVVIGAGTLDIGTSVAPLAGTSKTFPMPSSRAVRVTASGLLNVTDDGDFYIGVVDMANPTTLLSDIAKVVRVTQGTGLHKFDLDLLLGPSDLGTAKGRVGDLITLGLAGVNAGGAGTIQLAAPYDKLRVNYQRLPFLN